MNGWLTFEARWVKQGSRARNQDIHSSDKIIDVITSSASSSSSNNIFACEVQKREETVR
jgi:hypothetical protein